MKELGIKISRIAELLLISKSTIYRKTGIRKTGMRSSSSKNNFNNPNNSIGCNNNKTGKEPFGTLNSGRRYKHRQDIDTFLKNRISETALLYPFYGYRRICALIRKEGVLVNHKKVYRIYKD